MEKPKYIAEGFEEDAEELLNEFAKKNSFEFSEFATVWKKKHFSLIYMGRPDPTETSEFTNEAYRICTHFLSSSSLHERIGAVYLLYALYRNQIADPPIKIRIEIIHWRIIKNLRQEAVLKKYRTLHYVIDYLIKNSFMHVAHQTLKGPLTSSMQKTPKSHDVISTLNSVYKSDVIEYSKESNLEALKDLHVRYLESKKNLDNQIKVSLNANSEAYESLISDLNKLIRPPGKMEVSDSLGNRRSKIKTESFLRKTKDRFGQPIDTDNCETDDDPGEGVVRKKIRSRRVPKHERKIGRPSKKPKVEIPQEEKSNDGVDNIDISHLIDQQNDFYLPPEEEGKKIRCKPGRFYYKLSPKRGENNSSDPDDC